MKMTYLENYRQAINKGDVRVCERFGKWINTLADQAKSSERYIYDTTEAHTRIRWQEAYCIQSKGEYFGKRITYGLWQKAFWECLYSFKRKDTGKRRFTEAIILIGRKNGKSTMMASDGFYDLIKGQGICIACVSNSDAEAKLIWSEIDSMRMMLDSKGKHTGRNIFEIRFPAHRSSIIRMTSNQKNLEGRNIQKAYFDEAHECHDSEIYEATTRSMGISDDSLMVICTTNGYIRDKFLDEKITYAHGVCDGEIEDDTFLPWLYEQDTEDEIYTDRDSWRKSNPSLDYGVKKWSYMDDKMLKAQHSEKSRVAMLCKEFNIAQRATDQFLQYKDIEKNIPQFLGNIPRFAESLGRDWVYGIASVDLSKTSDLTCACILWQMPQDPTIYCLPHFWIPKTKLINGDDDEQSGADYTAWADAGYLTIVDGSEIYGSEVADWIKETAEETHIRPLYVGHDRWQSKQLVDQLDEYGIPHEALKQGPYLSSSTYRLKDEIIAGNVNFNGSPVMAWCLQNLKIAYTKDGDIKPVKARGSEKVDGAITMIMGIETLRTHQKELEEANG